MTAPLPRCQPDIVERLRGFRICSVRHGHYNPVPVCQEGADEIERLRGLLRRCMGGANGVDLGDGTMIALYLEPSPIPLEQEKSHD